MEFSRTQALVRGNLDKVRLWLCVSLGPMIFTNIRVLSVLDFSPKNVRSHRINFAFMVINALIVGLLWLSTRGKFQMTYWAMVIVTVRNLLPLYGCDVDFDEEKDEVLLGRTYIMIKCFLNCYVILISMQPTSQFLFLLSYLVTCVGFVLEFLGNAGQNGAFFVTTTALIIFSFGLIFHGLLSSMISNIMEEFLKKHQANQNLLTILSQMRPAVMVLQKSSDS